MDFSHFMLDFYLLLTVFGQIIRKRGEWVMEEMTKIFFAFLIMIKIVIK